ncbi:Uncharacterised protein [Mycobacteroides abscessus subsp. bolletii]|nr:Uncharacterised protein [Mycobacteroides abscessus subsp. bolletii]SLD12984.1 Uncharacterised protein [Mycobacteroides abscessus subsp. bolletii]
MGRHVSVGGSARVRQISILWPRLRPKLPVQDAPALASAPMAAHTVWRRDTRKPISQA